MLIRRQDPLENNSPVRKEFSWTGELLLDTEDSLDSHRLFRGLRGHRGLCLQRPEKFLQDPTVLQTAALRGDSLCHRQGCPDKNWEFIKLGKILPFHGKGRLIKKKHIWAAVPSSGPPPLPPTWDTLNILFLKTSHSIPNNTYFILKS